MYFNILTLKDGSCHENTGKDCKRQKQSGALGPDPCVALYLLNPGWYHLCSCYRRRNPAFFLQMQGGKRNIGLALL